MFVGSGPSAARPSLRHARNKCFPLQGDLGVSSGCPRGVLGRRGYPCQNGRLMTWRTGFLGGVQVSPMRNGKASWEATLSGRSPLSALLNGVRTHRMGLLGCSVGGPAAVAGAPSSPGPATASSMGPATASSPGPATASSVQPSSETTPRARFLA